jgi:cell division protein FtsN
VKQRWLVVKSEVRQKADLKQLEKREETAIGQSPVSTAAELHSKNSHQQQMLFQAPCSTLTLKGAFIYLPTSKFLNTRLMPNPADPAKMHQPKSATIKYRQL